MLDNTINIQSSLPTSYGQTYVSQIFSQPATAVGGVMQTSRNGGVRGLGAGVATLGSAVGGSIGRDVYQSVLTNGLNKSSISSGIKSGFSSAFKGAAGAGLGMSAAGAVLSAIAGPKQEYSGEKGSITKGLDTAYDAVSTAVSFIPGVGQIVGGAMQLGKGIGALTNKWGGGTDAMTTTDAILGSNFLNLTPFGLINGFGGKKAHTMDGKDFMTMGQLNNMWSGYSDTHADYMDALSKEGKKYGKFSSGARRRADKLIDASNINRQYLLDMNRGTELGNIRGNGMADIYGMQYAQSLAGGIQPISLGKAGMKFNSLQETIKNLPKLKIGGKVEQQSSVIKLWIPEDIQQFKDGGTVNVIPEGNLHARLHHMEDADGLTKKGIPVVDNNGNQQAEIELNEIIFRKEVTDKLEKLSKEGTDEAALEAGKLLVEEIFENTEDRTGLITEVTGEIPMHQKGANIQLFNSVLNDVLTNNPNGTTQENYGKAQAINNTMNTIGNVTNAFSQAFQSIMQAEEERKKKKEDEKNALLADQQQRLKDEQVRLAAQAVTNQQEQYNNYQRQQLYAQKNAPYLAQEGGELNLNFKTYQELLDYLKQTDRDSDKDYDLEAAFNDPEAFAIWKEEESKNPGRGHWIDKYKKPSHITYSIESKLGEDPINNGGIWTNVGDNDVFIVSEYLANQYPLEAYSRYFAKEEPNAYFQYRGKTYKPGRKKK